MSEATYDDLMETWYINHRIMLYLLHAVHDDALKSMPLGMRGRTVGELFAHIHNVRVMWCQSIHATQSTSIPTIPTRSANAYYPLRKTLLHERLTQSGEGLGKAIQDRLDTNQTEIFKPTPTAFVGYLLAHESYHRAEISMTLTQAGFPLDDAVQYGMWVWDKR